MHCDLNCASVKIIIKSRKVKVFRKHQGAKKRKLKSCQRIFLFAFLSIVPPKFTTELEKEKHSSSKPVRGIQASEVRRRRPCLIEMKQWNSFGKLRSCVVLGPRHNLIAQKPWFFSFPSFTEKKEHNKNASFRKGAVNGLPHSLHSEKSIIASSSWGICWVKRKWQSFHQKYPSSFKKLNFTGAGASERPPSIPRIGRI